MIIWTKKHDEAIQKTYEALVGKLEDCDDRKRCQEALTEVGWGHGPYSEFAPISEVVQKVLGNRAILEHCRKKLAAK
jgi:hypothetical protein